MIELGVALVICTAIAGGVFAACSDHTADFRKDASNALDRRRKLRVPPCDRCEHMREHVFDEVSHCLSHYCECPEAAERKKRMGEVPLTKSHCHEVRGSKGCKFKMKGAGE